MPDFRGRGVALATVLAARPDVLNHNLETVPRLYDEVRPGASLPRAPSSCCAPPRGARPPARRARQDRPHARPGRDRRTRSAPSLPTASRPASTSSPWASTCVPPPAACRSCATCPQTSSPRFRRCGERLGLRVVAGPFVRSSYRAAETFAGRSLTACVQWRRPSYRGPAVESRCAPSCLDVDFTVLRPSDLFSAAGYRATGRPLRPAPRRRQLGRGRAPRLRRRQGASRRARQRP